MTSMMETPVSLSPCKMACGIGEAPRHRGRRLPCTFRIPLECKFEVKNDKYRFERASKLESYLGNAWMTLLGIRCPKEATTPRSNRPSESAEEETGWW